MGCGVKLARAVLLIFTLIFLLIGLALLGAGIWMLVSQDRLFNVLNLINEHAGNSEIGDELERISQQKGVVATAGAILVAAGAISAVISFFGCMGAIKQSKFLLIIYAGIIGLLLGGQIAAAVLLMLYKDRAVSLASSQLLILQDKYLISINEFPTAVKQPESAVSLAFNSMFVSLRCCGVNNVTDAAASGSWQKSNRTWYNRGNLTVPATCCPLVDHADTTQLLVELRWDFLPEMLRSFSCPVSGDGMKTLPCVEALLAFVNQYSLWILVGCVAFAAAQLLVITFTFCLVCAISDDKKYG
ncbi:hypothetical protein BOX15_Mlig007532g1 [Macrostomum lignano]|uniref:Tetraspanin n=1 Tax=Macrostomum lignano TaxID=282301 RepID=A0A267EWL7_9PLAT|nr:hypothetical protein BOX15_Mlig007532g1 [Macrostomum lignano]